MSTLKKTQKHSFRVIDAMDAPHQGRVIRLRLQGGHPPALKELKGATLRARSPKGEEETLRVLGFFIPGGKPSDARFNRTGRIDLVVELEQGANGPAVSTLWEVSGPV
ncbi:MAG: hypothetical protein PVJ76_10105 [Gemmatimonadota bacterium]|jgi:hypothetical protein